jgi:predicted SAM-dependent methyltransferase
VITIDLGAADRPVPGAIALDRRPLPTTRIVADVRWLPFADASIDELISRHVIEHLLLEDARAALREWRRVLKIGGVLTLSCPDMLAMCRSYIRFHEQAEWPSLAALTHNFYGGQDYDLNHHYWGWNIRDMLMELGKAGFIRNRVMSPGDEHELNVHAVAG